MLKTIDDQKQSWKQFIDELLSYWNDVFQHVFGEISWVSLGVRRHKNWSNTDDQKLFQIRIFDTNALFWLLCLLNEKFCLVFVRSGTQKETKCLDFHLSHKVYQRLIDITSAMNIFVKQATFMELVVKSWSFEKSYEIGPRAHGVVAYCFSSIEPNIYVTSVKR